MDLLATINTWSDVYNVTKNATTKQIGNVFEYLVKYIFLIHPEFAKFTKNVYMYNEKPIDIMRKHKLLEIDK